MMISPAPLSARKMSLFGATAIQRGFLKLDAKMLMWNPSGTVGRNPAGGFSPRGPLPADFVAKGAGNFGFCPCVTCAGKVAAKSRLAAAQKAILRCINLAPL